MSTPAEADRQALYQKALMLLGRREHSRQELAAKLRGRGEISEHGEALVAEVCEKLMTQGYLSDERFAAAYARSRMQKGFGAMRIAEELRMRGIASQLIASVVAELDYRCADDDGLPAALWQLWCKKFGEPPTDAKQKAKQARFLLYRGHTHQDIQKLFERLRVSH